MRKQYLTWMIAVFGIVGTAYGGYTLAYHLNHGNGLKPWSLALLILGAAALLLVIALYLVTFIQRAKKKSEPVPPPVKEPIIEEPKPVIEEEPKPKPSEGPKLKEEIVASRPQRSYESPSVYDAPTIYVKLIGYGPILRIEGGRVLDMRSNTYYRIEGSMVKQEGSGPLFEIRGNQIKDAFGGYLYEYNGNNINKVFGGFYASVSGNYITLFDQSQKYEVTGSLSKNQMLAVAAVLFGKY